MNHPALTRKRKRETCHNWCDLPQNFLSSLLYFLSPKSRCALKATCKAWNQAELLLQVPVGSPSSPYHSSPLLMLTGRSTYEFRHPLKDESFQVSYNLKDAKVCYSNFGWLLMMSPYDDYIVPRMNFLFFFNPFTKQKIKLPLVHTGELSKMCFTSPPTSFDICQVFGWSRQSNVIVHLKLPEKNWSIYNFYNICELSSFHSPVFYRGSCYCFDYMGRIRVSNLDNNCAFSSHDTDLFNKIRVKEYFLLEVDGKLLGIFKSKAKRTEGVVVQWLDVERWEWYPIKPNDLKDKVLYLSNIRSFVQCDASTKGNGNRICIYDYRTNLPIHFSLDNKKYHSMDSTKTYEEGEIGDWWTNTTWITPDDGSCCSYF